MRRSCTERYIIELLLQLPDDTKSSASHMLKKVEGRDQRSKLVYRGLKPYSHFVIERSRIFGRRFSGGVTAFGGVRKR
jgi:hypothetical protein